MLFVALQPANFAPPSAAASPPTAAPIRSLEDVEDELTTLAGHLASAEYRFLVLLHEFMQRGGHVGFGLRSAAHWLSWRCGIDLKTARDKVRVAQALPGLPLISDAMRKGELSYSKVRAITRVATPANERYLVELAQTGTVTHVEKAVRLYRRTQRADELADANARHAARELRYRYDDQGFMVITARLDPEQGQLVLQTLRALVDDLSPEASREASSAAAIPAPPTAADHALRETSRALQPLDSRAARMADALVAMAEAARAAGPRPLSAGERHLVTVHVDEAVLRDEIAAGRCGLEGELPGDDGVPALAPATVRRLCCDASLVPIVEDERGHPLDVGRRTRAIPPALRRALDARDHGCRFPGCTHHRYVDGHHIEHWVDGGETNLDNLVLLCRSHHRLVHEEGFRVETRAGHIRFLTPSGLPIPASPAPAPLTLDGWLSAEAHPRRARPDHRRTHHHPTLDRRNPGLRRHRGGAAGSGWQSASYRLARVAGDTAVAMIQSRQRGRWLAWLKGGSGWRRARSRSSCRGAARTLGMALQAVAVMGEVALPQAMSAAWGTCQAAVRANCPGADEPVDQARCVGECEAYLAGDCATEYEAYLACTVGKDLECNGAGNIPGFPGCDAPSSAFLMCLWEF